MNIYVYTHMSLQKHQQYWYIYYKLCSIHARIGTIAQLQEFYSWEIKAPIVKWDPCFKMFWGAYYTVFLFAVHTSHISLKDTNALKLYQYLTALNCTRVKIYELWCFSLYFYLFCICRWRHCSEVKLSLKLCTSSNSYGRWRDMVSDALWEIILAVGKKGTSAEIFLVNDNSVTVVQVCQFTLQAVCSMKNTPMSLIPQALNHTVAPSHAINVTVFN